MQQLDHQHGSRSYARAERAYLDRYQAVQEQARIDQTAAEIDEERAHKAAYMRDYRAKKRAVREAVDARRMSTELGGPSGAYAYSGGNPRLRGFSDSSDENERRSNEPGDPAGANLLVGHVVRPQSLRSRDEPADGGDEANDRHSGCDSAVDDP